MYDEAEAVIQQDYDDERRVREQLDHYRQMGFPPHSGLIAGTVLLRRHNDSETIAASEEWYEHVLRFSKRDQISFNFVAWRRNFRHAFFGGSLHDNPYFLWPARPRTERLAADFDPSFYAWLNPELEQSGLSPEEHFLRARVANKVPRFKRHSWVLRKLANKYCSDKGSIYYNSHCYSDVYEHFLHNQREKPLKILELGLLRHDVQARNPGGPYDDTPSLAMWREYFPEATIYGFDIADFSTAPERSGVHIVRGDVGDENDLRRLIKISGGNFDIIIDDASHASHHQQIALGFLFPHLRPRGFYFIEDLTHQPASLEVPGATKTLSVLESLARGHLHETDYIEPQSQEHIWLNLDWIRTFDSFDRNFGKIHVDAFAVLRKSKAPRTHISRQ